MTPRALLFMTAFLGLVLADVRPAGAWTQPKARVSLHIQPHVQKAILACRPAEQGGFAPTNFPCDQYKMTGQLKTPYDVYVVVGGADSTAGIAGFQCGVEYDARPGEGIDVFGWTRCCDVDWPSYGPAGPWPEAGSGMIAVWTLPERCQTRSVPGYENDGVHAVVGAFYVFAYGEDILKLVPETSRGSSGHFAVADCGARATELQEAAFPRAVFGEPMIEEPCNPCRGPCAPDPGCRLSTLDIDFGTAPLGDVVYREIRVSNDGPGTLRCLAQVPMSWEFRVLDGSIAFELAPGESRDLKLYFRPLARGLRVTTLHMASMCLDVNLHGIGGSGSADAWVESRPGDSRPRVRFRLNEAGPVRAELFDIRGRRVRVLEDGVRGAGDQTLEWDASDLASGVYFVRVSAAGAASTVKLVLAR